jgi:CoA-transferase family III
VSLPFEGIKIIDFSQVRAGPACSRLLAWFGADVLKVERVDGGDITHHQLRDIPNVDALHGRRSGCIRLHGVVETGCCGLLRDFLARLVRSLRPEDIGEPHAVGRYAILGAEPNASRINVRSWQVPRREASRMSANFCPSVPIESTAPTPYS